MINTEGSKPVAPAAQVPTAAQEVPGSIASINNLLKTGIRFKVRDENKTVSYIKNMKLSLSDCILKSTNSFDYEDVGVTPEASDFIQSQESINLRQVDVSSVANEPFEKKGFHGEKSTWIVFVKCQNAVECAKDSKGQKKNVILITQIDNKSIATSAAAELVKIVKACVH